MKKSIKVLAVLSLIAILFQLCACASPSSGEDNTGACASASDATDISEDITSTSCAATSAGAAALSAVFKISISAPLADPKASAAETEEESASISAEAETEEETEISAVSSEETSAETALKETESIQLTAIEQYLAKETSAAQIIFVVGDGSAYGATLSYYESTGNGWSEILETYAQIGQNGFSDHTVEGDGTTPTGRYALGIAFGNNENPGTALQWIDVNPYLYWIDDLESDYYNLLIDSREVPDGWSSGEHLIDFNSYAYAINIEVNPSCAKDSTSAIFLHCFCLNPYSQGCVGIDEPYMVTLLQRLNPGGVIVIARDESQLADMTAAR